MVRKLVLAVAAASALMSSNMAQALGVGDINLRSALNQPLEAEIELLQVRDLSSQEILPALASPDEFGRAGLERPFFLTDLTFTPVVNASGRSVIRITSTRPVREPYLNFLMEVRWPSGRVLREFTLLLDPPLYDPTPVRAAAPIAPPVTAPVRVAPAQPREPVVAPGMPRSTPAAPSSTAATAPTPAAPAVAGEITTTRNDTLWDIALANRPAGASVHQTMLAIQDLNPGAFIDGNINRMRADQTLKMPSAADAAKRGQGDAVNQVAAQNTAWQAARQAAPAQRQLDARQQDVATAAPETAKTEDALRLVAGGDAEGQGSSESPDANAAVQLRNQLDMTKEQLDSVSREKAEADARLNEMQAQMETLQRLLELKDTQLATLQGQLGEDAVADAAVTDTDPAQVEPAAAEPSVADTDTTPVEAEEQGTEASAVDTADVDAAETDTSISDKKPADPKAATEAEETDKADTVVAPEPEQPVAEQVPAPVTPAPVTDTAPVAEQGPQALLQRLMQNQLFLLGGGAVLLLILLLILMALARRNARREEELADNFIARSMQDQPAQQEASDANEFNVALQGFEQDETETEQPLDIAQDAMLEADALLAYGKLEEAASVLKAGIEDEPARSELRLKLMEVEALQGNKQGYAEQASALRARGDVNDQVDALDARFPLMAAVASAGVAAAELIDDDYVEADELNDAAKVQAPSQDSDDFDFSGFELDSTTEEVQNESEATSDEGFDLDFDLDDSLTTGLADEPAASSVPESVVDADDVSLDFSLDDTPAAAETPAAETEFSLDEDFDLSLTEDLEADSLIAEMEAMGDLSEPEAEEEPAPAEGLSLSDDEMLDLEAELAALDGGAEAEAPADEAPSFDLPESEPVVEAQPERDEEDDEDDFDFLSGTDECATKLDLARAYIDMGDNEGARDILAEVLEEGNDQQKQDAQEMMGRLD
ncbi:MAG: peptigoglycan-binding protein LysM [Gammaproteobacteria bacterium HGW-Gammaproteobacteria-6]|nr:MAG: peptigoglycan-binding protein LysM [Gammaproteobacteria bacterium HGW-Gammaproteobacteria-6]